MKTSHKKSFIKCLDHYKNIKDLNYFEIMNILNLINIHYVENKYHDPYYNGMQFENNLIPVTSNIYKTQQKEGYYNLFSDSKWNEQNNYDVWKQKHEICLNPVEQIKEKIIIDASINTLDDILNIIKTNVYDDKREYNIDLKSLTQIQPELEKLNKMIGMKDLKNSILNQLLYFMQDLHITNKESDFKHTVLYGPPGTGKTEIAKIIGTMYSKIGILKNNVFKKVTRNDLVAGYLGQTAIKTKKVIDECLGGVLFIDEAYALGGDDSFSKECIDTLCEALSDHKQELMVIIAGYENELNDCFFNYNQGLDSRFTWRFKIDKYNGEELYQIFVKKIKENDWTVESEIEASWFQEKYDSFPFFGRDIETLLTKIKITHSKRVFCKPEKEKKRIILKDSFARILNTRPNVTKLFTDVIY
jgi:SpoVK/Ycf46/Vps4 family AAA+-type ATPase